MSECLYYCNVFGVAVTYGIDKRETGEFCVHCMAVGHVRKFQTIFKCQT